MLGKCSHILIILVFRASISVTFGQSPSFYGPTGLIKTPIAEVVENGKVIAGVGYSTDRPSRSSRPQRQWSVFGTIGFASRIEIGLRFILIPEIKSTLRRPPFDVGADRMMSIKYLLIKEKDFVPSFALGVQDIIGTRIYNSLYVVGSKNFYFPPIRSVRVHAGFGTEWWDHLLGESKGHKFKGLFGGLEVKLFAPLILVGEYDGDEFNWGVRVSIRNLMSIAIIVTDENDLGGVLSFGFSL